MGITTIHIEVAEYEVCHHTELICGPHVQSLCVRDVFEDIMEHVGKVCRGRICCGVETGRNVLHGQNEKAQIFVVLVRRRAATQETDGATDECCNF